jgi:protein SCO1
VGFHFMYDARTDQYAHPDGVMILTPKGKVARYFFRLEYPARDLRYGLIQAAEGRIGSVVDAIALLCFHYNPVTGKYGLVALNVVRLAGLVTVLMMVVGILVLKRRDRSTRQAALEAPLKLEG